MNISKATTGREKLGDSGISSSQNQKANDNLGKKSSSIDDNNDSDSINSIESSYANISNAPNVSNETDNTALFIENWFTRSGNPRNYIFQCKVPNCSYKGYKRERALAHLSCHEGLRPRAMEISGNQYKNKRINSNDTKFENHSPSKRMATKEQGEDSCSTTSAKTVSAPVDANNLVLRFLLRKNLPLSYVSDDAFLDYSNGLLLLGKQDVNDISEVLYAKTTFIDEFLPKFVEKNYDDYENSLNRYKVYGFSLISDSRTDIVRESILVIGLQSHGCYRMVKVVYADACKKDSKYYYEILSTIIKENPFITSICNDSASVCISCSLQIEADFSIVFIRCQAHAFNNVIKHIFQAGYFVELLKSCCALIHFYRSYHSVCKSSKEMIGMELIQFSVTRYGGIFFMFQRIYSLLDKLTAHLRSDELKCITDTPKNALASERNKCFSIVTDPQFKRNLEFAVSISTPIIKYLFMIDHGHVSAGVAWPMWSSIADSLASCLGQFDDIELKTRISISRKFYSDWNKFCSPALYTAALLNPHLFENFHQMHLQRGYVETNQTLNELKKHASDVLKKVCKRYLNYSQEADVAFSQIQRDINKYLNGEFGKIKNDESIIEYWERQHDTILSHYAPMVLNMSMSNSNVERNHKIFSAIRNSQRNIMKNENLSMVVKGHLAVTTNNDQSNLIHQVNVNDLLCWKDEEELKNFDKWLETAKENDKSEREIKKAKKWGVTSASLPSSNKDNNASFDGEELVVDVPNPEEKEISEWLQQMDEENPDEDDENEMDTNKVKADTDIAQSSSSSSICEGNQTKLLFALQKSKPFHERNHSESTT